MTTERLSEGDLARMREHLAQAKVFEEDGYGPAVRPWIEQARGHLEQLLEQAEAELQAAGGGLAARIRQALEERILREVRGRAELTVDTTAESLGVHVLPSGVVVDVRLKIGRWQQ